MKLSSMRYLIKEGFKGAWANRLMSLASIGVLVACMVVIGLAILISENVTMAIGNLEKQNVVMVYMKDYNWALYGDTESEEPESAESTESAENTENTESVDDTSSENAEDTVDENGIKQTDYVIHNEEEAAALCDKISALSNVESVEYISREAGLETVKENMLDGQEEYFTFLDDQYGNPLSDAAKVTMKEMSLFDETIKQIEDIEGVGSIQSYGGLAEKIDAIKQGIYVAGFWIIAILIVISLVIVSNTIRVTMYNRKLEISIMKAVGATDTFVRIPFVIEGVIIGLISALVSEGLIYFCYRVATEKIEVMLGSVVAFGEVAVYLLLVFVAIGIFAGALGSAFMIGKYLKHEGSEFTAI
ncbi:MAG: ABC transporter permease [Clostridia bacterium]|nr:ABC transporter permease [Clostridia bacterium]